MSNQKTKRAKTKSTDILTVVKPEEIINLYPRPQKPKIKKFQFQLNKRRTPRKKIIPSGSDLKIIRLGDEATKKQTKKYTELIRQTAEATPVTPVTKGKKQRRKRKKHEAAKRLRTHSRRSSMFARLTSSVLLMRRWAELSEPKRWPIAHQIHRGGKEPLYKIMRRVEYLARPRSYAQKYEEVRAAEEELKRQRSKPRIGPLKLGGISQRTWALAQLPLRRRPTIPSLGMDRVRSSALIAIASNRIKELAKPKLRSFDVDDTRDDAFMVSPNAKRYVPSPRILELAEPLWRQHEN